VRGDLYFYILNTLVLFIFNHFHFRQNNSPNSKKVL